MTVGMAIERYSHEYRPPRGVFLSVNHPEDVGSPDATDRHKPSRKQQRLSPKNSLSTVMTAHLPRHLWSGSRN
jgi:hypothetical protein